MSYWGIWWKIGRNRASCTMLYALMRHVEGMSRAYYPGVISAVVNMRYGGRATTIADSRLGCYYWFWERYGSNFLEIPITDEKKKRTNYLCVRVILKRASSLLLFCELLFECFCFGMCKKNVLSWTAEVINCVDCLLALYLWQSINFLNVKMN